MEHDGERHVDFAALTAPDVVPVQTCPEAEFLLRESTLLTQSPQHQAKREVVGALGVGYGGDRASDLPGRLPHIWFDASANLVRLWRAS